MCGFMGLVGSREKFKEGVRRIAVRGSSPVTFHCGAMNESYAYARLPTDCLAEGSLARVGKDLPLLFFNGLITNTAELVDRFKLSEAAYLSDHYCLREGFSRFGSEFLGCCRGMFAFAFVEDDEIRIVRDTVGIKPLYYVYDESIFAFASEMKALQVFGKTIHEVSPGEIVCFSKDDFKLWTDYFVYSGTGDVDLDEALYESTVLPTQRYLKQSSKDIGILLSGGLDSSILVKLLAKNFRADEFKRVVAFSIGNEESSDLMIAKRLAEDLGIRHIIVPLPDEEILMAGLEDVVFRAESSESRVIKVALLYEEIARVVKDCGIGVVIGGEGADELFFGYSRFIEGLSYEQSEELFADFYRHVFPRSLLQRYDRVFAGRRIEGRVPFLDQVVIKCADDLSTEDKLGGGMSKAPLRKLARDLGLPDYVFNREKEKMTSGATGRANSSDSDGFLEEMAQRLCSDSFAGVVRGVYMKHFPFEIGHSYLFTEEDLMKRVKLFKKVNKGV